MKATSLWRLPALVASLLLSSLPSVASQTDLCSDGTTVGYSSLEALVNDEVNLPATSELRGYVLCPDIIFPSAWTPIVSPGQPIVLLCGQDGNPRNNCTVPGVVLSSPISTHISVVGATFTGFSQAAISGTASSNTTIEVKNSIFRDFDSMFVIEQQLADGLTPFKVEVKDSTIVDGAGGVAFSNAGGELSIEDLTVANSSFASLVATGSTGKQEGSAFLRRLVVTESDIEDIFVAMEAADIDAISVTVTEMKSMGTVFNVRGAGSFAAIDSLAITNNDFGESGGDSRWIGVDVSMRASATATNLLASNSSHVRHVVSASSDASLSVSNSKVIDIMGGRAVNTQDVSAIAFANSRGEIVARRFEVETIDMFTAIFFGNAGSNLEVSLSCVGAGSAQAAVYASEETTLQTTDNFIHTDYASSVCPEFGKQLVKERPGAGCFQTNRTDCTFDCETFFDAVECLADSTDSPSVIPSNSPSLSFAPAAQSQPPSSTPIDTPSSIPTSGDGITQSPTPSSVMDSTTVPDLTSPPVISFTTEAPTPPRAFDVTPLPGSTSAPAITLVTSVPTPSRMVDTTAIPGSTTSSPVISLATSFPVVVSPGRDIPLTPSLPTASAPTLTEIPGTTSSTNPTLHPSTFLSTLIRPSPDSPSLLIPLPSGSSPTSPSPDSPNLLIPRPPGSSPTAQGANGALLPTVEPMTEIGAPATSSILGSQMPSASQIGSTPSPIAGSQPVPSSPSLAQSPLPGTPSGTTSAPAVSSLESPSSTTSPTTFIISSPSMKPGIQPDRSRMPSAPTSQKPSTQTQGSSDQPGYLAPDRHKPSYVEVPQPTTSHESCDCGKSSKKMKAKGSKGKSKGESGSHCHCSKGKGKSGKGKSSGKGMKKGYVRQSYQVNHALHGLDNQ